MLKLTIILLKIQSKTSYLSIHTFVSVGYKKSTMKKKSTCRNRNSVIRFAVSGIQL